MISLDVMSCSLVEQNPVVLKRAALIAKVNQWTQCEPPFACFICRAYYSTMKMEAARFSETMVTYIPNFMASHPQKN